MSKKYFATKAEQKLEVDVIFEEFGENGLDWNDEQLEEKFIAEEYGARDSDGDFLFFDTLEEMNPLANKPLEDGEIREMWEDDDVDCVREKLMSAAVEMYEGPWDESEIIAIVLEAIAVKHLGGVQ